MKVTPCHLPKAGALVKGKGWLWTKASQKPKQQWVGQLLGWTMGLGPHQPPNGAASGKQSLRRHEACCTYTFAELGKVGWWVCQLDVSCLDSQPEKQVAWPLCNPTSLQKGKPHAEVPLTPRSLCQHLWQLLWNLPECPGGPPWLPPRFSENSQATPLHEFAPSSGWHIKANPNRDAWRWCPYYWKGQNMV